MRETVQPVVVEILALMAALVVTVLLSCYAGWC